MEKGIRGRLPNGDPNPIDIHVGRRLRVRRIELGITQEKLGATLRITFQQVQKYENGINRLGASRLFDAARALNVEVGYFFDGLDGEGDSLTQIPQENLRAETRVMALIKQYRELPERFQKTLLMIAKALGEEAKEA